MRRQVALEEIIDAAVFGLRAKMYKCMPGIVVAGGTATVDVQPAVHDVRFDPVLGSRVSEPWPVLPAVPVAWLQVGPFAIVGTLQPGDKVVLLSFDLDPSLHRGTGNAEDPADTARHSGAYWVAVPANITDAGALSSPGASLVLGAPSGVQVQIGTSTVSLGAANAADAVGLASKIDAAVATIVAAFNNHTHTVASFGTPGSAPLKIAPPGPGVIPPAPGSVKSTTVKAV